MIAGASASVGVPVIGGWVWAVAALLVAAIVLAEVIAVRIDRRLERERAAGAAEQRAAELAWRRQIFGASKRPEREGRS